MPEFYNLFMVMFMKHNKQQLIVVRPRGFCAGVDRAIAIVNQMLSKVDGQLYVRKEIVHNTAVVDDFRNRGVVFVDELDEVPAGKTVVFSAHGVSPEVRAHAKQLELNVVDATCPLVTKVHNRVIRNADKGRLIVLIGHKGHDEVVGTMGEAPDEIVLVTKPGDISSIPNPGDREVYYVTQTTLSIDETADIVDALRARFPDLKGPGRSDICYATQNRQDGVKRLVEEGISQLLVVGSTNSSNSQRLCEVAQKSGVPAELLGRVSELPEGILFREGLVGLTAGASAPEYLVIEIVNKFRESNWDIREFVVMEEDISFDIPATIKK